ncbi:unnamed protein product [Moneuplotes crassus]|uniref:Uncharacterized protein n=1 Tax=Euplotes crassus TaxID=5936 RepID=A0AAD2D6Y3_EUPCR|nr:unnamed protein product [Moneuplotes crassus]
MDSYQRSSSLYYSALSDEEVSRRHSSFNHRRVIRLNPKLAAVLKQVEGIENWINQTSECLYKQHPDPSINSTQLNLFKDLTSPIKHQCEELKQKIAENNTCHSCTKKLNKIVNEIKKTSFIRSLYENPFLKENSNQEYQNSCKLKEKIKNIDEQHRKTKGNQYKLNQGLIQKLKRYKGQQNSFADGLIDEMGEKEIRVDYSSDQQSHQAHENLSKLSSIQKKSKSVKSCEGNIRRMERKSQRSRHSNRGIKKFKVSDNEEDIRPSLMVKKGIRNSSSKRSKTNNQIGHSEMRGYNRLSHSSSSILSDYYGPSCHRSRSILHNNNAVESVFSHSNIRMNPREEQRENLGIDPTLAIGRFNKCKGMRQHHFEEIQQDNRIEQSSQDYGSMQELFNPKEGAKITYYLTNPEDIEFLSSCKQKLNYLEFLQFYCSEAIKSEFIHYVKKYFPKKVDHLKWSGSYLDIEGYRSWIIKKSKSVQKVLEIHKFTLTQPQLEDIVDECKQKIVIYLSNCKIIVKDDQKFDRYVRGTKNLQTSNVILEIDDSITSSFKSMSKHIHS